MISAGFRHGIVLGRSAHPFSRRLCRVACFRLGGFDLGTPVAGRTPSARGRVRRVRPPHRGFAAMERNPCRSWLHGSATWGRPWPPHLGCVPWWRPQLHKPPRPRLRKTTKMTLKVSNSIKVSHQRNQKPSPVGVIGPSREADGAGGRTGLNHKPTVSARIPAPPHVGQRRSSLPLHDPNLPNITLTHAFVPHRHQDHPGVSLVLDNHRKLGCHQPTAQKPAWDGANPTFGDGALTWMLAPHRHHDHPGAGAPSMA